MKIVKRLFVALVLVFFTMVGAEIFAAGVGNYISTLFGWGSTTLTGQILTIVFTVLLFGVYVFGDWTVSIEGGDDDGESTQN